MKHFDFKPFCADQKLFKFVLKICLTFQPAFFQMLRFFIFPRIFWSGLISMAFEGTSEGALLTADFIINFDSNSFGFRPTELKLSKYPKRIKFDSSQNDYIEFYFKFFFLIYNTKPIFLQFRAVFQTVGDAKKTCHQEHYFNQSSLWSFKKKCYNQNSHKTTNIL